MIILVTGLPGTGKSTLASALAEKLHARYISTDIVRKTESQAEYSEEKKMEVYQLILEKIDFGHDYVLDGTFYSQRIRDFFEEKAIEKGHGFTIIEMTADEKIIEKRVSEIRKWTDAGFEVYLKLRSSYEPVQEKHLTLDSGKYSLPEMVDKALSYIKNYEEK